MPIPIFTESEIFEHLAATQNPFFEDYYAFYSSWFGGIVKNPRLMLLPIDDHMVHRGDGVFEAIKVTGRSVYLLDEHLQRLFTSAEKIALKSPFNMEKIKEVTLATLRAADQNDALIRIFLSRGPGNFSVNPYDSIAPQLYIIITKPKPPVAEKYQRGVCIGKSAVPAKSAWMAQIKSCNYLHNVLMKKEAVDRNLDFVIALDEADHVTESATENMMIVDQDGVLVHPPLANILKGTMMLRACELAEKDGFKVVARPIPLPELTSAREVMMAGTTLNVLPVVQFEGQIIGDGKPGFVSKKLLQLILADIKSDFCSTPY